MKIKPTTIFTLVISATIALVVYFRPVWLPDLFLNWLAGYNKKQISGSLLPYYVYAVIVLSSILSIAKFNNNKLPIIDAVLNFTSNGLIKAGYKILGSLIIVTAYVYLSEGERPALLGFVLGCYLILFTYGPVWMGAMLLEMSKEKESKLLMPRGYKVLFYFTSVFSLGISIYGAIAQLFFS